MVNLEDMGMLDEAEVAEYSKFNVKLIDSEDATSPLWSNILKTILAAGSLASCFL